MMSEASEFDVSTDDGFAAFFAATFDDAYEYADHLSGHDPDMAEQLVRLVFGFARRHAQQGRVTVLSDTTLSNAIRNAWSDQRTDDTPSPSADSVWATGSAPRAALYGELFAEMFGEPAPTRPIERPRAATDDDPDRRGFPAYRAAAYAVLAGVIVVVLAVTLRDSASTEPPTTPVTTTATTVEAATTSTEATTSTSAVATSDATTSTAAADTTSTTAP